MILEIQKIDINHLDICNDLYLICGLGDSDMYSGQFWSSLQVNRGKKPGSLLKTPRERLKEGSVDLGRVNQKAAVKSFVNV